MATQENQQRNFNEISMNEETKNQYHKDLSHDFHHVPKLSPNHLSYPISPINTPPSEQDQPYYVSEAVSQPLHNILYLKYLKIII